MIDYSAQASGLSCPGGAQPLPAVERINGDPSRCLAPEVSTMWVHLLGTAAGGGFPQWNCNCTNCRSARAGRARPRSQSCVAVSPDGQSWFLLNASPDLRAQIESFAPLRPGGAGRGTAVEGILLTNAELDHTLGLFLLREGEHLAIRATPAVRRTLADGLALTTVLARYCPVDWIEPPVELGPLSRRDGTPSGLRYAAFSVPGQPPRYLDGRSAPAAGAHVGYRIVDPATGGRLAFLPDVAALDEALFATLRDCDALLFDGTFWSQDEMRSMGVGTATAADMGHLPIGGSEGSLAQLAELPCGLKIYIHINNTNPILLEDSAERLAVEAAGVAVGYDGWDFSL
jgi:pyrroloquinoline quinone biosynthesis protein B